MPASSSSRALVWISSAEVALVVVLLLGDIGFDHSGRFGLDFGHALILLALFLVLWPIGIWKAVSSKAWRILSGQPLLPFAAIAALLVLQRPAPIPRFDAHDWQHLVGRDESAVQAELGDARGATLVKLERDGAVEHRELELAGMTVRYSSEGKVAAVVSNGR